LNALLFCVISLAPLALTVWQVSQPVSSPLAVPAMIAGSATALTVLAPGLMASVAAPNAGPLRVTVPQLDAQHSPATPPQLTSPELATRCVPYEL
jgi:hypothetical protein